MFFDFSKLGEMVPKIEEIAKKILADFEEIRTEQKEQRTLLEEIRNKILEEKEI